MDINIDPKTKKRLRMKTSDIFFGILFVLEIYFLIVFTMTF